MRPPEREKGDVSERISPLISNPLPSGALRENVEGRKVMGPDDGFGTHWRKRFWIPLTGANVLPQELVTIWKDRYTEFWPKGSHLYQPPDGLQKGDVAAADLSVIGGARIGTGIVVIDEQDTSFTFATLQGHMLAGTITFSGKDDAGVTVAQVEVDMRAGDPLYEIGMFLGGHQYENRFWQAGLVALGRYFGVTAEPEMSQECIDRLPRWRNAGNIVHNAFVHSGFYVVSRPIKRLVNRIRSRGTSS